MLIFGAVDTGEFTDEQVTEQVSRGGWWTALALGLAIAGVVVQLRAADRLRGSMRESWADRRA